MIFLQHYAAGRTFRKVTLPLMIPGVLSGALMSWVTAINEVSTSILLAVTGVALFVVNRFFGLKKESFVG